MSDILTETLTIEELNQRGIFQWPVWEKEVSEFDWHYDQEEVCYILEGEVVVSYRDNQITLTEGQFVTFPQGLACTWNIISPIKKHYNFI